MSPGRRIAWRLEQHAVVDSTQDVLKRRLAGGEDVAWVVVRARAQTAGRGRRGGEWLSDTGGSYSTFAVPEPPGVGPTPLLPLAVGVGVAESLAGAGAPCAVKWPNDLYYRGKKLGGILVERAKGHLLIGIGINVDNPIPPGSVALAGVLTRAAVQDLVLEGVETALELTAEASESLPDDLRRRFAARDWLFGKLVTVEDAVALGGISASAGQADGVAGPAPNRSLTGVARGIAADGSLLLQVGENEEPYRVRAGTIGTYR